LHAFHLKFTFNAIVYIPVESKFSTSLLCPNHRGQYFNSWSIARFTVSWLTWVQQFNRTHFR